MSSENQTEDTNIEEENLPEEAASGDAPEEASVDQAEESSQDPLEAALAEIGQLKDQMIRDQAETQNIRRRVQKDVENARKFALEKFVNELLPVADNLERAMTATSDHEDVKPVLEGVELTYKSLIDVFKKFGVEQINPVGEPFDPQEHEAITMVPNPDMEPNSVMDVMQRGYKLNGRLVRAAMVVVSKAP